MIHLFCNWKSVPLKFPRLFLSSPPFPTLRATTCLPSLWITFCFGYICSFVRFCLFRSLPHFLIKLLVYLRLTWTSSLCILGVRVCSVGQSCPTLRPDGQEPTRPLCPSKFSGKGTGVGCRFLLQDISWPREGTVSLESPALAGRFFTASTMWGPPHPIFWILTPYWVYHLQISSLFQQADFSFYW